MYNLLPGAPALAADFAFSKGSLWSPVALSKGSLWYPVACAGPACRHAMLALAKLSCVAHFTGIFTWKPLYQVWIIPSILFQVPEWRVRFKLCTICLISVLCGPCNLRIVPWRNLLVCWWLWRCLEVRRPSPQQLLLLWWSYTHGELQGDMHRTRISICSLAKWSSQPQWQGCPWQAAILQCSLLCFEWAVLHIVLPDFMEPGVKDV